MLFEFHEQRLPEAHVVRIAVTGFDDELAYLHWYDPGFEVASAQNFGLNVMLSGSSADCTTTNRGEMRSAIESRGQTTRLASILQRKSKT
jgi:hypothetical protein